MKLCLPLAVVLPRKKKKDLKFILNLNTYRNTHYHTLNEAKVAYVVEVAKALEAAQIAAGKAIPGLLELRYTLFPRTRQITDVANPCSIIDKFTCDALVHLGVLECDDFTKITRTVYCYGAVDKHAPRCELEIIGCLPQEGGLF